MTDYWTPFASAAEAESAFVAFVADHGGVGGALAMKAYENAFAVEAWSEYADDRHRWTVALGTAKDCAA